MKKMFFIIPVYKVEDYLNRCIDSVLMQTYPNVEIILVDDGSPDNCPKICDEYATKFENIVVIHKENGGLSDARNKGLLYIREKADSEDYFTFLDSDDFVRNDFSKTIIELMEKYNCNIAQCGYEKGCDDDFSSCTSDSKIVATDFENALLGYRLKSQSCAKVYKVYTFDDILFPVNVYNEDEFVTYRAIYNAKNIVFTDDKLYYYYQHNTSIMDNIAKKLKNNPRRHDFLKAYNERIKFFEEKNLPVQVLKTREKICRDIILRYCEQMNLKKEDRCEDFARGTIFKTYKENYIKMIRRRKMPIKCIIMYTAFLIMPYSAVFAGKMFTLRK